MVANNTPPPLVRINGQDIISTLERVGELSGNSDVLWHYVPKEINEVRIEAGWQHLPDGQWICVVVTVLRDGTVRVKVEDWTHPSGGSSGDNLYPGKEYLAFSMEPDGIPAYLK